MALQVLLVPVYLSHWSVETYGVWLSLYAVMSILCLLDFGHQEFLAYEFLRLGRGNAPEVSRYLWSGIVVSIVINVVEVAFLLFFSTSGALPLLLGKANTLDPALVRDAGYVLLVQSIIGPVTSIAGLFFRALSPFGHFARMIWWGLLTSTAAAVVPVTAVSLGADLWITGLATACATVLCNIPVYIDLVGLARREAIKFSRPSWKLGYYNFTRSLAIFGKVLLENVRQQGVRLVLAPLSGAAGLVAFSTMRTGANVALQGLRTIINPLMPELVRFLHQRDQERVDASFGIVWIMVVALMAPAIVLLQAFIEPFFAIWTRGQVPFDPLLFAVLSLTILVYAVAQPAIAVVIGNNMLKPQVILSAVAALIVIGLLCLLVPYMGILGASIALLVAEIVATRGYRKVARDWLIQHGLVWPERHFTIAVTSVWIAAIAMGAMTQFPAMKWFILACSMPLFLGNMWRYWQILPAFATQRIRKLMVNLPVLKNLYPT